MSEYQLDGHDLDDPQGRWLLTDATTLPSWGAPRLVSTEVPGRTGVLPTVPTSADPITITLGLLITDSGMGRPGLDANLRALAVMFRRHDRLLTLTHSPAGAPAREAMVRLSGAIEPEFYPAGSAAVLLVVLEAPSGLWRDVDEAVAPATDLSALDGGAMPIPDAVLRVTPSAQRIVIQDAVSGDTLAWEGSLVSGATLIIRPAEFAAVWSTEADATAGLSLPAHGFNLTPDSTGHHGLTVQGGVVEVVARRCF
ncbi:hypothetical protein [Actinomyces ruminis]|uniref:Phage-related protein n=1 Tax=Actinomyces ruminis TaxID=1937003 RepID=A0ABX4MER0_9ACTO|nr:hypothetical protein [Actinomyces ruminis]PHP52597.1 hypothetical protein BW737_008940 [Actinomyces ruminis]